MCFIVLHLLVGVTWHINEDFVQSKILSLSCSLSHSHTNRHTHAHTHKHAHTHTLIVCLKYKWPQLGSCLASYPSNCFFGSGNCVYWWTHRKDILLSLVFYLCLLSFVFIYSHFKCSGHFVFNISLLSICMHANLIISSLWFIDTVVKLFCSLFKFYFLSFTHLCLRVL